MNNYDEQDYRSRKTDDYFHEELLEPKVCPMCGGYGYLIYLSDQPECTECDGTGDIYE